MGFSQRPLNLGVGNRPSCEYCVKFAVDNPPFHDHSRKRHMTTRHTSRGTHCYTSRRYIQPPTYIMIWIIKLLWTSGSAELCSARPRCLWEAPWCLVSTVMRFGVQDAFIFPKTATQSFSPWLPKSPLAIKCMKTFHAKFSLRFLAVRPITSPYAGNYITMDAYRSPFSWNGSVKNASPWTLGMRQIKRSLNRLTKR